jgi:hypothetical protein
VADFLTQWTELLQAMAGAPTRFSSIRSRIGQASQRAQVVGDLVELPDHLGIPEIAGGLAAARPGCPRASRQPEQPRAASLATATCD